MTRIYSEEHVRSVRSYFANIGLWQAPFDINPKGWLANFDDTDRATAVALLDSFVYFNAAMLRKQFAAGLSRSVSQQLGDIDAHTVQARWVQLLSEALFSMPSTNPTDSGHLFLRFIRDDFGVDEARIFETPALVGRLSELTIPVPVVLVDDFAGTGDQFVRAVNRRWSSGDESTSVAFQLKRLNVIRPLYVVSVATTSAKIRIEQKTDFTVSAGNVLLPTSSITHDNTHLVPPSLRSEVRDLIERYSRHAGIPESQVWGWRGSGLCISFQHKTPNNTLGIFTWRRNNWTPLVNF